MECLSTGVLDYSPPYIVFVSFTIRLSIHSSRSLDNVELFQLTSGRPKSDKNSLSDKAQAPHTGIGHLLKTSSHGSRGELTTFLDQ